jgi:6-phosphogluconate dehydrogenase
MSNQHYDFGMIGLGVMGRNFLLNVADDGYAALGQDVNAEQVSALNEEGKGMDVRGVASQEEFVALLAKPRKIMLLVPAGKIVDAVIDNLLPHLEEGDIIIDGGNSHYDDTNRRYAALQEKGIRFLGTGVSGGAKGARLGPSIMPGGDRDAWNEVQSILETVAAKVDDEPCVTYIGERSSGHFVKMVHNGIEYGLMQLLSETYDILQRVGKLGNEDLHETFSSWNEGRLNSFLVEITAAIMEQEDPLTHDFLLDHILDKAKQKGTGKWTSQSAMDLGVPVPTIDAAVTMRGISSYKQFRQELDRQIATPDRSEVELDSAALVQQMEKALYFAFVVCYAQGLHLLSVASKGLEYHLDLEGIAKIWRGGCIIRAALLERFRNVFDREPEIENIIAAAEFRDELMDCRAAVIGILHLASERGVPALCLSSALHYFDAFRAGRLPLNLVQAQRDYFGSHTYERTDREGTFHTDWD